MSEPHMRISPLKDVFPPNGTEKSDENLEHRFLAFYGLNEQPFGVTPDPRFLYLGTKHKQALAALTYGTDSNRGFMTLIGNPGMGKTSLLFQYLDSLGDKPRTAFVFQTDCDARDLMYYILTDLGIDCADKGLAEMRSTLNQVLLDDMKIDRRFVLVIDEAQNLDEKALESVRLLSNFERPWMKLIQIVLAGQPQLAEKLARPSMSQFRQRISLSIKIEPFTREEVDAYVDHRLQVSGYEGPPLFDSGARALLTQYSEGIPRNINNLCFYAMSLAWALKQETVTEKTMADALEDLGTGPPAEKANAAPQGMVEPEQSTQQKVSPPVPAVKESEKHAGQPIAPAGRAVNTAPTRTWLPKILSI